MKFLLLLFFVLVFITGCISRYFNADCGLCLVNKSKEEIVSFTVICDNKYVMRDVEVKRMCESSYFPFFSGENEIQVYVSFKKDGIIKYMDAKKIHFSDVSSGRYFVITVNENGYICFSSIFPL